MAYTAIDDPSAYFKIQLYTGDGSANHAITFDDTDTDMQPDLVWIKNRDATDSHCLFDAARGATEVLHSDTDDAEVTDTDTLDSFTSDGFQVDADVKVNTNTEDYVAWCWNTQGGAGSSNTTGSINTTTTSVGTTQGFSISTYTGNDTAGATVGHGLGKKPDLISTKRRDGSSNWITYHNNVGGMDATDYLNWNDNGAFADYAGMWNDTEPTSTVFSLGDDSGGNGSNPYIVYCWTSIQGFSKFGSYVGNNSGANGVFVYTGFRPALVIQKNASNANGEWQMTDVKRNPFNPANTKLNIDTTSADFSNFAIDILSNGFKTRADGSDQQNVGEVYAYMAFAEAPLVNSNGVPCNAR